ncbi:hypothetical protein ACA910_008740 [Epithemia clementina (nom. ined.)]
MCIAVHNRVAQGCSTFSSNQNTSNVSQPAAADDSSASAAPQSPDESWSLVPVPSTTTTQGDHTKNGSDAFEKNKDGATATQSSQTASASAKQEPCVMDDQSEHAPPPPAVLGSADATTGEASQEEATTTTQAMTAVRTSTDNPPKFWYSTAIIIWDAIDSSRVPTRDSLSQKILVTAPVLSHVTITFIILVFALPQWLEVYHRHHYHPLWSSSNRSSSTTTSLSEYHQHVNQQLSDQMQERKFARISRAYWDQLPDGWSAQQQVDYWATQPSLTTLQYQVNLVFKFMVLLMILLLFCMGQIHQNMKKLLPKKSAQTGACKTQVQTSETTTTTNTQSKDPLNAAAKKTAERLSNESTTRGSLGDVEDEPTSCGFALVKNLAVTAWKFVHKMMILLFTDGIYTQALLVAFVLSAVHMLWLYYHIHEYKEHNHFWHCKLLRQQT